MPSPRHIDAAATIPMPGRARTLSSEFMCAGEPLTPERARLHVLDTARLPAPPRCLTTGRIEDRYARRIRTESGGWRTWLLLVVVSAAAGALAAGLVAVLAGKLGGGM